MADPISLILIGTAVTGGVLSAVGKVQQHEQAKANAEMQEAQLNYNKRLEEREAAAVEAETAENARRQRIETEKLKAQQRALLGKSGAAMDSGSPLAILGQTAIDEELRVQGVHYGGYNQAQQHREKAKMLNYQAGVARAQAPSGSSLALSLLGTGVNTVGSAVNAYAGGELRELQIKSLKKGA